MFVSVEGLDGSGKSTVIDAITDEYPGAVTTAEPSDGQFGQIIRDRLSDDASDQLIDFYVFMADRIDHINDTIRPADEDGKLVISDRYADSTRCYQPVAMVEAGIFDSAMEAKYFIEQTMRPWNYEPDLTLYIDVSVDTAMNRADGSEKYEDRQFLEQVKHNYDALASSDEFSDRIIRIDGEQPEDEMVASALGKIDVASPDRL